MTPILGFIAPPRMTMVLWRPRQRIFLDRACISQEDPSLQLQGLLSLGAILKQADSMMVLWDSSWSRRTAEPVHAGPAGHHDPGGVAKLLQFFVLLFGTIRMDDHDPYTGQRVGEASHPGPSGGGSRATDRRREESTFDVGRVLALLQELVTLLGGNTDALSQLTGLLSGLQVGVRDDVRDAPAPQPARRVTVDDPWQR